MNLLAEEKLQQLKENTNTLVDWQEAINRLQRSGILDFLRLLFQPVIHQGVSMESVAIEGAYTSGANQVLNALLALKSLYFMEPASEQTLLKRDFGAIDLAEKMGHFTKEEADARRAGTNVSYKRILDSGAAKGS